MRLRLGTFVVALERERPSLFVDHYQLLFIPQRGGTQSPTQPWGLSAASAVLGALLGGIAGGGRPPEPCLEVVKPLLRRTAWLEFREVEQATAYLVADWFCRSYTGLWFKHWGMDDLAKDIVAIPRIQDEGSAEAAVKTLIRLNQPSVTPKLSDSHGRWTGAHFHVARNLSELHDTTWMAVTNAVTRVLPWESVTVKAVHAAGLLAGFKAPAPGGADGDKILRDLGDSLIQMVGEAEHLVARVDP